jgi:methylglutaconyl-CoA hydratase
MDEFETLKLDRDGRGILTVTLNLPAKKNALSAQMVADLTQFSDGAAKDAANRVVLLRGAGDVFCAGGDLGWMKQQIEADRDGRMAEARKLAHMLRALNEMPLPLIGSLHGGAFGGGVGIACVCDVAIAETGTKFGLTETRLGLIPATISPYVIARMGEGKARRVFMSARVFSAQEAKDLDIISDYAVAHDMEARIEAEIAPYLSVAPNAVAASKALARSLGPRIGDAVIEDTVKRLADTWEGEEVREGIDAFLNKRKPRWA